MNLSGGSYQGWTLELSAFIPCTTARWLCVSWTVLSFRVSRFAFCASRFALYASRLCSRQRVFQRKLLICFVWKPSSVVTAFYKWHKCLWLLRSEITFKTFYSRFTFRFVIFKAKMTDGQMLTIASIKYSRLTHEAVTSREKLPCFRIII